ncbi:type II and III secretion system protein family protein [Brevundimonas sp. 2R-24]|uniref:Type II and III secretion system protein family protein n=1 Tax=Peiella sedimenti TaxID=3061083 RepID=A0ABT8SK79_9CAUL|nr:type II and III secretion system protein family protein [Caulobacteraceae bacterium XZ-24]
MMRPLKTLAALIPAVALGLTPAAAPVAAQAQSAVRVNLSGTGEASQSISIPRGRSATVDLPVDARDVLVSNPAVADAVLQSPRRIVIMGVASGQTDASFFDAAGRRILTLNIRVDAGTDAAEATIRRLLPASDIRVEAVNESLILTGRAANPGDAETAQRLAAQFVAPERVVNMMSISGSDQVTLRVRVVEVNRTVVKQLGFDTNAVLGRLGEPQYFLGNSPTFGVNGGLLGGLNGGYRVDTTQRPMLGVPCAPGVTGTCMDIVSGNPNDPNYVPNWRSATNQTVAGNSGVNSARAAIQAFERVGLLRTLAEPNVTSTNGQPANFLAGGEFPVPTGRDSQGNAIIEYKPFGVLLNFTPVVLSNGNISLQIATEVSEISNAASFTLGQGEGALVLPAFSVRRVENTVELPSGGAMMIAGLLQESTRQNIDGLPGATNLPILGALFRSRDYLSGETELVIIIEAYLTRPGAPGDFQTPADGLQIASDMQTILFGRLNQAYRPGAPAAPAAGWQGPVGYVIE